MVFTVIVTHKLNLINLIFWLLCVKCAVKLSVSNGLVEGRYMLFLGMVLLSLSILLLVLGLKVLSKPKSEYVHNHKLTGSVSNALQGNMNHTSASSPEEISKGFTVDLRNGELVSCSQLSREAIKSV